MIKIGIDATFNLHGGSHGHLNGIIENLESSEEKLEILLFLNPNNLSRLNKNILDKCTIKLIKISSLGNFFRILWCQFILPLIAKLYDLDVLFCPGNFSPIIKTTKVKSQWIATIGPFCKDMYKGVSLIKKLNLFVNKFLILLSAQTSNVVIHQAEYSKQLFEKKYNFISSKQYLIACGKDEFYKPDITSIQSSNVLTKISSNDLLYVSHLFPYKNILRLINSFENYKSANNSACKLFIVGKIMDDNYFSLLKNTLVNKNLEDQVYFTGMANKNELKFAYSKCKLFVFPSLCESSGYTLIEAMSCGAAILASDKTAIPFTCKNAAIYFNGYDERDLFTKLTKILSNDSQLKLMKKKSLERASEMINYKISTNIFLDIIKSNLKK
jgi:glycosyltransferase involved in cell wall biosynthesis